jgi:hypothetical protein
MIGEHLTTLMRQIEHRLKKENDLLTMWFNAGRYERETQYTIVSLLKTIAYEMDKNSRYDKVNQIILKSLSTNLEMTELILTHFY